MKVLHISSLVSGGAFTGMYRLHKAMLSAGIDSKLLVRDTINKLNDPGIVQYCQTFRHENLRNRFLAKIGHSTTALQKKKRYLNGIDAGEYEIISFPFSNYDITESSAYNEADIINLHWVGDYLDYETFFKKNIKPVVWTLRDSYPFLGIFHLNGDKIRNSEKWKELDDEMISFKQTQLKRLKSKLAIVGISKDITEKSESSELLGTYPHYTIYNCIDANDYKCPTKVEARKLLDIDQNRIVFSFVADSLKRYNKGFRELKEAISKIETTNMEFLSCGDSCQALPISVRYRSFGRLRQEDLKIVYAASDAFIFPTKEEALGNVMLEAMACGTPVIGTPIGGLPEVIEDGFNGVLSTGTSSDELKIAIERFLKLKDSFDSAKIKSFIREQFSPQKIAGKYMQLYQSLLN